MRRIPLYVLAIVGAAIFLIPLLWTVSTSLKTRQQSFASPPEWVPRSYRVRIDGQFRPANVTARLLTPAAVVVIKSGPRAGQTIAVEQSNLIVKADKHFVRLKSPEPVEVDVIQRMPDGLVQAKVDGKDVFVAPADLQDYIDPQFSNFKTAWNDLDHGGQLPLPFYIFVWNTWTVTILCIIGHTLSCSLVAYGFARFRFKGRKALFLLLLSTMMLPSQVTMIPVYMIWNTARLTDTFAPLTIPAFFAQNAFFVFLLRQFFLSVPRELDEAAMIDGCGPLRIWWQILMPLSKPAITTVAVLGFISHWDDFVGPLIYLNSMRNYTVSMALRLFQDQNGSEFNLLMAAALIHLTPVLLLFFIAQRYFVKGIATTGIKA